MHMLKDFRGYLQTDGYGVYDKYGKKEGVTHLACWAHARRYLNNNIIKSSLQTIPVNECFSYTCL
jgi:hypothetical protein